MSLSGPWSTTTGMRFRRIYGEGIDTRNATFAAEVPSREHLHERWLPQHRWVATIGGVVVGWAALSPVSERDCYRGVVENSVYVADGMRGRGVGKALLRKQVMAADADGLWTLQTSMFPENRASISLHHSAGFRTVRPSREDRRTRRPCGATLFCSSVERRSPEG